MEWKDPLSIQGGKLFYSISFSTVPNVLLAEKRHLPHRCLELENDPYKKLLYQWNYCFSHKNVICIIRIISYFM